MTERRGRITVLKVAQPPPAVAVEYTTVATNRGRSPFPPIQPYTLPHPHDSPPQDPPLQPGPEAAYKNTLSAAETACYDVAMEENHIDIADLNTRSVMQGVAAVIRDETGRYLMILRAQHLILGGWWCFPGGGVQDGESQAEALERELREELDIAVESGEPIWSWTREDRLLSVTFRWAKHRGGEIQCNPDEVQKARWMSPGEIRTLDHVLPNNLQLLEKIERL